MKKLKSWARVRVPASTSNLGPGFDVLGLALGLANELEVWVKPVAGKPRVRFQILGEGARSLPKDERNAIWQAGRALLEQCDFPYEDHSFYLRAVNRIPLARGLGSSAVARLSGILAFNALAGSPLSREEAMALAARMEGHADNVVPSCLGGLCACAVSDDRIRYLRFAPPRGLCAVVCLPDFELSTERARAVLPRTVPLRDAVANVGNTALLLGALLRGGYSGLRPAMADRFHQEQRKKLVPGFDRVTARGYAAGALGIALSGAGPAVFAFAVKSRAGSIGAAMRRGFKEAGRNARSLALPFDAKGAVILCR